MSRRTRQRKKEEAKTDAAPAPKGRLAFFRFRRVTIAVAAVFLALLLLRLVGGGEPPRISLINRTGETLTALRVDYPGGNVENDPLPDGGSTTFVLRPPGGDAKPPPDGMLTLSFQRANGLPFRLTSRSLGRTPGGHDIFTAVVAPNGNLDVHLNPPGGIGMRFGDLLRRLGIGR